MEDSILNSVKKYLGLQADYNVFDQDILMAINSAMMSLHQLGVGPAMGFAVNGETETWGSFLAEQPNVFVQGVRAFVYTKVRLLFDPPSTSFGIDALEKQMRELEWRLNVQVDPKPLYLQGVNDAAV